MTRFAAAALRTLAIEAGQVKASHALRAHDLLAAAVPYAAMRSLDVIALECLFVAMLDGTKASDEAYRAARADMLVPVRTAVIRSDDPLAELEAKIARLQRAADYNQRSESEALIRTLVNQTRKAFPGLGIKVVASNGMVTVTSDLVIRNCGLRVTFGSATPATMGELLVKCEEDLADWAWEQLHRLRCMSVILVRRGQDYVPVKRRLSSRRRRNSNRYEAMSRQEALRQAA